MTNLCGQIPYAIGPCVTILRFQFIPPKSRHNSSDGVILAGQRNLKYRRSQSVSATMECTVGIALCASTKKSCFHIRAAFGCDNDRLALYTVQIT